MSCVNYANDASNTLYVMICTRPDIPGDVSVVSKYMSNPKRSTRSCEISFEVSNRDNRRGFNIWEETDSKR